MKYLAGADDGVVQLGFLEHLRKRLPVRADSLFTKVVNEVPRFGCIRASTCEKGVARRSAETLLDVRAVENYCAGACCERLKMRRRALRGGARKARNVELSAQIVRDEEEDILWYERRKCSGGHNT